MRGTFKINRDDYVEAIEAGITAGGFDGTPAATALRDLATKAKRIAFGYTKAETCYCPLGRLRYIVTDKADAVNYGDLNQRGRNAGIPSDAAAGDFMSTFDEAMVDAARDADDDGNAANAFDDAHYGVAVIV